MSTIFNKLLYKEIPEGFTHKLVRPLSIIWGVITAGGLVGITFLFGSIENFHNVYAYFDTPGRKTLLYIFLAVTIFSVLFRSYYAIVSITHHKKKLGEPINDRYATFVISSIIIQGVAMFCIYILLGLGLYLLGYSFFNSWNLNFVIDFFKNIVNDVPTIVQLPYWISLLIIIIILDFTRYWWHRLAHESRLLWLLAHRPHHIPTTLSAATTFDADPSFALGKIWKIVSVSFIGACVVKLFHSGSYFFIEIFLLKIIYSTVEIFNHNSAYYEVTRKNKFLYFIMMFFASGAFHQLHHSSNPKHTVVNVSNGISLFMMWDRIFDTYSSPPKQLPKFGLTKQPEIYHNPLNLTFSGLLQIFYELKHNTSLYERFKIIFGGIYYLPPKTKSFLMKDEMAYYNSDEKVAKYNPDMKFESDKQ